jgi:predicted amidohydrolase YtcJ
VLAGYGVTGVSDLTATDRVEDLESLANVAARADFPLDLMVTGGPTLADTNVGIVRGPVKILIRDDALPSVEDVCVAMRRARRAGRNVAVHCVTRIAVLLAQAAWEEVGVTVGDRIEHGAVIPIEIIPWIRDAGLTVVTQPSFVVERGDQYLHDVDTDDVIDLWRCGSLLESGVPVAGSTDAPFGDPDPWQAIHSAVNRTTKTGQLLGSRERVAARRALAMFTSPLQYPGGPPPTITKGAPADLCVLRTPLADALSNPSSELVAATVVRSRMWTAQ